MTTVRVTCPLCEMCEREARDYQAESEYAANVLHGRFGGAA